MLETGSLNQCLQNFTALPELFSEVKLKKYSMFYSNLNSNLKVQNRKMFQICLDQARLRLKIICETIHSKNNILELPL